MASRPPPARRRPRPGSLERPVNGRTYRGTLLLVAIPLLITAFTVSRPEALPPPTFPPSFDEVGAVGTARELAQTFPNRAPGSPEAPGAADWVAQRLRSFGFRVERDRFRADLTGRGSVPLENVLAISPGRSPDVLLVLAHRDNLGSGPGANDNASGTGALLELARGYGLRAAVGSGRRAAGPTHTILFLSSDGGAFGGAGIDRFLGTSPFRSRIRAAINLIAIGGPDRPRLDLAADRPRSPDATLIETAAARFRQRASIEPERPSAAAQLIDLAFPFSLYEQAPLIGRGIPAVTFTTSAWRPPRPLGDSVERLREGRMTQVGLASEGVLGSLDEGVPLAGDTSSYVYLGHRVVEGWAIKLVLIGALVPFLLAAVDLFARCRRRRIALAPAFRSYWSRLGFWLWSGAVFGVLALLGAWTDGDSKPPPPDVPSVGRWPVLAVAVLTALMALGWLVTRERLIPRRAVGADEELAGQTTALLVLGVLGLMTVATNPFALIFVLPSLHAWLWLPQVRHRPVWARAAVLAVGFAGPMLILGSFAWRFDLGLDAPLYLLELAALGSIPVPAILITLGWFAAAGQLAAIAAGRYAPYPSARERPPRGPVRELVRQLLLLGLRRTPAARRRAIRAAAGS